MVVNRYTQPSFTRYNPLSLQELSYAPSILRQRHDKALENIASIEALRNQYNVLDQYGQVASQLVDPLGKELESLASDLSSKGVMDSRAVDRATKLAVEQNRLFSPNGDIGKLQAASKSFQSGLDELRKRKDLPPELLAAALSRAKAGEAVYDPMTGQLNISSHNIPNLVKHISKEDITKSIIDNVSKLKDSDLGISADKFGNILNKIGSANSYTDVYQIVENSGISQDRVAAVTNALLGTEQMAAISQYSKYMNPDDPTGEKGLKNFINEIYGYNKTNKEGKQEFVPGLIQSLTSNKPDRTFKFLENAAAKKRNNDMLAGLTQTPGNLVERNIQNTLGEAGWKFDETGNNLESKVDFNIDKWLVYGSPNPTGAFGRNVVKAISNILNDPSIILAMRMEQSMPGITASKWKQMNLSREQKVKLNNEIKKQVKKDFETSIEEYKKAYPEAAKGKTNKQIYEGVLNARNNFSAAYTNPRMPIEADYDRINNMILGDGETTGDFIRRQIFSGDSELGTGDEFIKSLGYESFAEFKEKGQAQIMPSVSFGAKIPAALTGQVLDSDGNPVSFNIQSNKEIETAGVPASSLLKMVEQGKMFKEFTPEETYSNFYGTTEKDNSAYYIFDIERQQPILVEAPSNLKIDEVKKYMTEDNITTYDELATTAAQNIFFKTNIGKLLTK